jgi:hypothetical protein
MKRFWFFLATFTLTLIALPSAHASSTIILTEPTHRQINGQFIDDDLATSLDLGGRLGQLVFNPPLSVHTWIIDPALIEEVTAMSTGYTLTSGATGTGALFAKSWLAQLEIAIKAQKVIAMAYGNPNLSWVKKLSPHEVNYVLTISGDRLATLLGRAIKKTTTYPPNAPFSASHLEIATIMTDLSYFSETASYVDPATIDIYRLALIKILNPDLTKDRREYLVRDLTATAFAQIHLVHLSSGKFTITSTHQKLPITLTNGFPAEIKVNLSVIPTNLKVEVNELPQITIPAKSKIQVMVPITVLTSGTSGLSAEIISSRGNLLGDPIIYPLTLSVISPVATWFTTGAAILLFIAATIQSVRRIRRRNR